MNYSASGDTGAPRSRRSTSRSARTRRSACRPRAARPPTSPASRPATIALMQRGTCPFAQKVDQRAGRRRGRRDHLQLGHDPGNEGVVAGTLGETAQDGQPDAARRHDPGRRHLLRRGRPARQESDPTTGQIIVDAKSDQRKSTNILADTRSGDPDNVTIVGSHLDSVLEGPGINDNGSGSAFNLELALQMAKQRIRTENRVRFAFWGAEESGLVGATRYVAAISDEEFAKIAANLNFDMLASPNHGKFVYDGDFSDTPPPATAPNVNPGAAYIERDFLKLLQVRRDRTGPDRVRRPQRLQAVPGQRDRRRRPVLRRGGREVRGAGRQVGRHGRRGVRPELPPGRRRHRQPRPRRLGAARRRRRPRAGDRWPRTATSARRSPAARRPPRRRSPRRLARPRGRRRVPRPARRRASGARAACWPSTAATGSSGRPGRHPVHARGGRVAAPRALDHPLRVMRTRSGVWNDATVVDRGVRGGRARGR